MSKQPSAMLTTGEFARLCRVTKDTLFHYDNIGLLPPAVKKSNRYRYYSVQQLYTFEIITVLKECGTPLVQIKEFLQNPGNDQFLSILSDKQKLLRQEQARLNQLDTVLSNTMDLIKQTSRVTINEPFIETVPEEYFIAFPLDYSLSDQLDVVRADAIFRLLNYLKDQQLGEEYPIVTIINQEDLLNASLAESCYCSKFSKPQNSPYAFTKPAGTYAVLHHKGPYEAMNDSYLLLLSYIKKNSLKISGCSYEYELLNYLAASTPEEYIIQIAIQVQKA